MAATISDRPCAALTGSGCCLHPEPRAAGRGGRSIEWSRPPSPSSMRSMLCCWASVISVSRTHPKSDLRSGARVLGRPPCPDRGRGRREYAPCAPRPWSARAAAASGCAGRALSRVACGPAGLRGSSCRSRRRASSRTERTGARPGRASSRTLHGPVGIRLLLQRVKANGRRVRRTANRSDVTELGETRATFYIAGPTARRARERSNC